MNTKKREELLALRTAMTKALAEVNALLAQDGGSDEDELKHALAFELGISADRVALKSVNRAAQFREEPPLTCPAADEFAQSCMGALSAVRGLAARVLGGTT